MSGGAFIAAYLAASQSGKSTLIRARMAEWRGRMPVWDFKREYGSDVGRLAPSIPALCAALKARDARVVFRPSFDDRLRAREFNAFCRAAVAAVYADKAPTLMVVEELAFVTTPSWAPPGWRQCTSTGMGLGLSVIGSSQMPAQVDKAFFGNTTEIYCGTLTELEHAKYMSKVYGVEAERILHLPRYQFLYRHRDRPGAIETVGTPGPVKKKSAPRAAKPL